MATPATDLELTTWKLINICRTDFQMGADTGITGPFLWACCQLIRTKVPPDSQPNEGYNSLLKVVAQRSRTIGLPLLSARANIKKGLGVGSRGSSKKWSEIRSSAEKVLLDAVEHVDASEEAAREPDKRKTRR